MLLALLHQGVVAGGESVRLVYLVVEEDRLIASNVLFHRFDEFRLSAKESISERVVAKAAAVIATNQRIIAYSVFTASWHALRVKADETVLSVEAEDFSAFVVTSDRLLSFNGKSGAWSQKRK